ncbi:CoA-binding protein [Zavarzinia aquatilis]|uniref:CoA-binding protein n=1 Tax=Zavarzinia aquatilis TaxID=2211142 RepID=A0A317EFF5_9PROT|nr:CoA-binding protein [Zavarzinia aquatilis]PWR25768.1 CoA-binding protein [Zavarzinia aquatilis]
MAYPRDDAALRRLLTETRVIALVGASAKPARASHEVMEYLLHRGYRVIPVNPGLAGQTILGQTVVARLADIGEPIDMVDIFREESALAGVVDEAIAIKAKSVWMQLGLADNSARAKAEHAGLTVVMDRCPKIEIPRLGL